MKQIRNYLQSHDTGILLLRTTMGTGLVEKLLDTVTEAARASGALELRLYVLESNGRAIAAYHRCGFDVAPYAIMTRSLA